MASALAQDTESTPSGRAPHSLEMAGSRTLAYIALGPRGSWFTRWSDGHTVWEGIPATLHTKLHGRSSQLPHVRSLSMLGQSEWVVVFDDGSICSSGFGLFGRLTAELDACQVKCLVLAPACGWLLVRLDGSVSYERLPTGLSGLLERRTSIDPPIDQVCISGVGAWFVRFTDGECLWNGLPDTMQELLIKEIRRGDPSVHASLSPCDGHSYFLKIGSSVLYMHDSDTLQSALDWANGLPMPDSDTVVLTLTPPNSRPQSPSNC